MTPQHYQQRIIAEKVDLDVERTKLDVFLNSPKAQELPVHELMLLVRQSSVMGEYSAILGERIAGF